MGPPNTPRKQCPPPSSVPTESALGSPSAQPDYTLDKANLQILVISAALAEGFAENRQHYEASIEKQKQDEENRRREARIEKQKQDEEDALTGLLMLQQGSRSMPQVALWNSPKRTPETQRWFKQNVERSNSETATTGSSSAFAASPATSTPLRGRHTMSLEHITNPQVPERDRNPVLAPGTSQAPPVGLYTPPAASRNPTIRIVPPTTPGTPTQGSVPMHQAEIPHSDPNSFPPALLRSPPRFPPPSSDTPLGTVPTPNPIKLIIKWGNAPDTTTIHASDDLLNYEDFKLVLAQKIGADRVQKGAFRLWDDKEKKEGEKKPLEWLDFVKAGMEIFVYVEG